MRSARAVLRLPALVLVALSISAAMLVAQTDTGRRRAVAAPVARAPIVRAPIALQRQTPQQPTRLTATVTGTSARVTAPITAGAGVSAVRLPITYRPPAATPGAPSDAVYEPRLEIDRFGLTWQPAKRVFAGTLRVQVIDTLRPLQRPARLAQPITLQLRADGGTVSPDVPEVSETNRITPVAISTVRRESPLRLHVVPLGAATSTDLDIAVTLAPLELLIVDTIPGFGLGRAEATIGLPLGADGDSVMVTLLPSHGSVAPEHMWVRSGRPGYAVFRSGGVREGTLTVTAPGTGYAAARAVVAYAFPTGFAIAALLGVLAAGIAKMALKGLSWDRRTIFSVFVGGLVTGVVVAILVSVLGVTIFDFFDPGGGWGLAGVFVLAVAGAWAGSPIFDRLFSWGARST